MDIAGYLGEIRDKYASGQTTEHSFRPALAGLFAQIDPAVSVINEPKRTVDVGAPDFVFQRGGISIGWCEAKDIGKDVRKFAAGDYSKEQKGRYAKGLPNLIYTNGLDFEFIRDGQTQAFVTIADLSPAFTARPDEFAVLERLLRDFAQQTPVSITSAKRLAEMMAGKAAIIKDIMGRALVADDAAGIGTELTDQYLGFKTSLIHDISMADFADIYAETIAYGLFAARLHDTTQGTFSRTEALELLPKSNPFLRNLFVYIAGPNLDDRLVRMIDDLCAIFLATDLADLLKDFGKFTARNDPFLHFYETFLAEYNPAKRKARGVWYTPEPVVNFIVRAVDDVLKSEFGLADGLADTSKVSIDWDTGQNDQKGKPIIEKKDVHRVQILDPATGTGTFLAEVIKLVAGRVKGVAPGQWSGYVEKDLIPRLHGFELLMASYAMCHLKLDMMLTEMGYNPSASPPRLSVYLTNSLEEGERVEQTLPFARWVSEEAKGANTIKRDQPIMCVIGNPPYSGESANKGAWIMGLMEAYKKEPGGKQKLQERNPKWINDDYVKFIRLAEHMIAKNGEGVLGFITNHGYLDNPTFRGMRWHLLDTFDKIYVLDLHGNAKKKEVCPDGSPDKNVFDIMQGVAIIIGVKRRAEASKAKGLAEVLHGDLWGNRESKNDRLWELDHKNASSKVVGLRRPHLGLVDRNEDLEIQYGAWLSVADLFQAGGTGVVTKRDKLSIHMQRDGVWEAVQDMLNRPESEVRLKYDLPEDVRDWRYPWAVADVANSPSPDKIKPISYRPFDQRFIYFTGRSRGFVGWPVEKLMRNFILGPNVGLATARSNKNPVPDQFFITQHMMETKCAESSTQSAVFPLYIYPTEDQLDQSTRLNLDPKLYAQIRAAAGLTGPIPPVDDEAVRSGAFRHATGDMRPDEIKVFDYIYGVLHSPAYRETYREFLKIDFPRVPFPRDPATFAAVSAQGEALRRLHLMEDAAIGETPYPFVGEGAEGSDCVVAKPWFEPIPPPTGEGDREAGEGHVPHTRGSALPPVPLPHPADGPPPRSGEEFGRVWINATQYFTGVSQIAWNFHIGGYQPAQKWLKDRKGRMLSYDDIRHYQKVIKILGETDRIMREIELPLD